MLVDLIQSVIGAGVWLILLIIWNITFQLNRVGWGMLGDQLTFIVPRGIP